MGASTLNVVVKGRFAVTTVAMLMGILIPAAAHSANRRSLALTSFDLQTNLRGPRVVSISRLKAALTEHLELMGESVRVVDVGPGARRCLTRECQMALAKESQADILYGDIEQTTEASFSITLWLWRFDKDTGNPITEYPVGLKEACINCDELSLMQKLLEKIGSVIEQRIEPSLEVESKVPVAFLRPHPVGREGSRWQRLSTKRIVGAAILGTVSAISLISAVTLTIIEPSKNPIIVSAYDNDIGSTRDVGLFANLAPFYGSAYGISAATSAGLLAVLLW